MSAWIVSKRHIDALVEAGLRGEGPSRGLRWHNGSNHLSPHGELDFNNRNEVGRMLWFENLKSILARYPDTAETDTNYPGPTDFTPEDIEAYRCSLDTPCYSPVEVLKAIDCYEYQSCEHEGWEGSEARAFCEALRRKTINRLPGYDNAPWGID